jgi:3'-5' exoribonuclease
MSRRLITELQPQTQIDQLFLATHKQLRPNRNGQLYLQVDLADKSGMITGRLWNASDDDFDAFEDGDYVRVEGHTQLYSGSLQLIVTAIERADPRTVDETEFRVLSTADVERPSVAARRASNIITPTPAGSSTTSSICSGSPTGSPRSTPISTAIY